MYLIRTKVAANSGHAARDLPPAHRRLPVLRSAPTRLAQSEVQVPHLVQGSLGGEYLRRSLDLVSWQAAQDRVRGWEASGEVGLVRADIPSVTEAVKRFFEDAKARGLAEATIGS